MEVGFELIFILALILINAFLAASEIALVSCSKPLMRSLADDGNSSARRVVNMTETPTKFLATIQVGITIASFFAAAVGSVTITELIKDWVAELPIGIIADHASTVSFTVITLALSFVTIVFGELIPKTMAVNHADSLALRIATPVDILAKIMRPIIRFLTGITNFFLKLFGSEDRADSPSVTEAEILALLEVAEDEGVVEPSDADLVEEALEFGGIEVRSVMVPRVDVEALDSTTTVGDSIKVFFDTGYSRLPVYQDTPDDILGILHIKDVFHYLWENPNSVSLPVSEFVRPAYVVPETRHIDELLQDLKDQRTHMAVVADEYGGMAGVVTLEDLIEELVGEIADEFDAGYEPLRQLDTDLFEADGRLSLRDLLDRLNLDKSMMDDVEAESVGGLIHDVLERLPDVGDVVEVGPLRIEVKSVDGNRVGLTQVERLTEGKDQQEPPEEASAD